MYDKLLVQTALGQEKADLAIIGGKLVNVLTEEIYPANVAIKGERIAYVGDVQHCLGPSTRTIDAKDHYLVPGLIDPHLHPEVCKLTMNRLAEAMLPRGTTTIFAGMDYTWAVTGIEGVKFALAEARKTPLRIIYHPYARVPVTGLEPESTVLFTFGSSDMKKVLEWPGTMGPMDTVIDWILGANPDMLEMMRTVQEKGLLVHGHDTLERGPRMQAFLTTGIRSDHIPFAADEALEKLRAGMWVMFSEGPLSPGLLATVLKALTETKVSTRHATFCTDDMEAQDLLDKGHIDIQVRDAIAAGLDPVRAVQMATLNAAEVHRMDHLIGSIAPGRYADVLIVNDLAKFNIRQVISGGELVVENGKFLKQLKSPQYPVVFQQSFSLKHRIIPEHISLRADPKAKKAKVLVLNTPSYSPLRFGKTAVLDVVNGEVQADLTNDILYCAVVERHKKTGNIGVGMVSGYNLKGGTIAGSLTGPTGNIVCLGSDKGDMAIAINRIVEIGGGQVAVRDGEVIREIPLPIGGTMADVPPAEMAKMEKALSDVTHQWGCPIERPFLFLVFMEIVGLPEYSITEHGVISFASMSYVNPVLETVS